MNKNIVLSKRQRQFIERLAWGASYKEVADFFHVSWSTVDNTLRKAKEKIGLNKVTELGAWWFCTNYNISFDLSPMAKQFIASGCLCLFLFADTIIYTDANYTIRRSRRTRLEHRARRNEISASQPYII